MSDQTVDPVALLKKRQGPLSLRQFADEIGISAAFLSDIYNRKREPGWKALEYIGLEKIVRRVVEYRKAR
jgi:hypothetical protein